VSAIKTSRTADRTAVIGARAKDVAAQAVPMGKRAGTTAVQGVRQGVHGAREWAAPRLEDAAGAVTASVAPRVASALRSAARQVRPEETRSARTGVRAMLSWRWLLGAGAAVAAAGAAAAIAMRQRYARATADAEKATESSPDESARGSELNGDAAPGSGDDARVTKSGR
jgi:hypothetical protein